MRGLLVGYGSIGRRHLANFHQLGVEDWAVVHTGLGSRPLDTPGPVRTYADVEQALLVEKPTFAIIANPTTLHLDTALACVEAGCDFLIEKPVSQALEGVDSLAAAARARGVKSLVGFQFRFHPALRRIEQLLRDQTLGRPLHARVVWGEYLPGWQPGVDWRRSYAARPELGGGVHHTICHPFDYLRMLFGDPSDLTASLTANGPLELDVAEAADVQLRFDGAVVVQLHLDYWSRPPTHRVEIICADGTIEWDYLAGSFRVWEARQQAWRSEVYPGVANRNDLFLAEARHFLDVIEGRTEPACSLEDGIEVVRICTAVDACGASGAGASLPS